ncbi:metallo-beta-lactamase domain-containing protein 1 [Pectinophora gossypiella]|uniref:metallo-beta-lactamase domain-containing protein 1 n=1 Tax=Pectinophora gossypiella TaxID=13191 RepID=UPI00214E3C42|nr:metallo-beta-lactamase domain-containing protein 1 [Pectinophora gossypiella]
MSEINVLFDGYSIMSANEEEMTANCSCTLLKGSHNIIVDTMTAWDGEKIITALKEHDLNPEDIHYVVSTHGHSDHIGNNNLFLNAKHIVGFSISFRNKYYMHPFDKGEPYIINESVKVIPTPGHTLSDVTVLATSLQGEMVAMTGDLFEKFGDVENPKIWLEAGSEDPVKQLKNRLKVVEVADWIVPGHGSKFQVTPEIRQCLINQVGDSPT